MFDRELLSRITGYLQVARDPSLTPAYRLEHMLLAFTVILHAIAENTETMQRYWDNSNLSASYQAAGQDDAIGTGGTIKKRTIAKYLAMIASFRTWLTSPVSAQVTETPLQLLSRAQERVV